MNHLPITYQTYSTERNCHIKKIQRPKHRIQREKKPLVLSHIFLSREQVRPIHQKQQRNVYPLNTSLLEQHMSVRDYTH